MAIHCAPQGRGSLGTGKSLSHPALAAGLLWLLAGSGCYTAGVAFFALDSRLRYGHLIWHLFVMAGTVCHYLAVLWYAA